MVRLNRTDGTESLVQEGCGNVAEIVAAHKAITIREGMTVG
jgi:hypothetical protein